ncbi:SIS domain-containing protein [Micromonospora sp. CPCC 205546]|uniref:SIS domain-containing protein n=1 Tax=Micromonospora sp. CPCC 205546 TaxID=3122397 RepID=UPI002FEE6AE2
MEPEVLLRQVSCLREDLSAMVPAVSERLAGILAADDPADYESVILTGDGDSHHAGLATALAYETFAGLTCDAISALELLEYATGRVERAGPGRTLVIAASASGATERVVQVLERASKLGARTLAITATPGSPVTRVADDHVAFALPGNERSPGMRTYQVSVTTMLLAAIRLGEVRARLDPAAADRLRAELSASADAIADTAGMLSAPCQDIAEKIAPASVVVAVGSGPSRGSASFAAAKLVEAAGCFAIGQDAEEWCHVERFAAPRDMPMLVFAPAGRAQWCANAAGVRASTLGRRVVAVTPADNTELVQAGWRHLPMPATLREEFSPLVYGVVGGVLAAHLARARGWIPFQGGAPAPVEQSVTQPIRDVSSSGRNGDHSSPS